MTLCRYCDEEGVFECTAHEDDMMYCRQHYTEHLKTVDECESCYTNVCDYTDFRVCCRNVYCEECFIDHVEYHDTPPTCVPYGPGWVKLPD